MDTETRRQMVEYGVALLTTGVALLCWHILTRYIGPGLPPYLTFYPAVMLSATMYGLGPGLLATVVSTLLTASFILPLNRLAEGNPVDILSLVVFAWMGTGNEPPVRVVSSDARPGDAFPAAPHCAAGSPSSSSARRGPLLAFAVIVLIWLVGGYRADQDRRHADTARALALAVDADIRAWKTALQALAGSHALQQERLSASYEEARAVARPARGVDCPLRRDRPTAA